MRSRIFQIIFLLLAVCIFTRTAFADSTSTAGCLSTDPNCYILLAPLPLQNPSLPDQLNQTTNPNEYIAGIIDLTIAVVGGLTVLRLIFAGFQYITTENFSKKSNAKGDIQNAIWALLLTICAFTLLNVISPQFTNLGLHIDPINPEYQGAITPQGTCTGPTAADGTCTTPPTGNGDAAAAGCSNNCTAATSFSFPQKPAGTACTGSVCYVNQSLGSQLESLNTLLKKDGISWQVSEMFPPTVPHMDDCHKPNNSQTGTCVDATFLNASDPAVMGKIMKDASQVFSSFVYEACPSSRTNQLKSQFPQYASHFNCYNTTDGDNMHINMSGGSGSF